MATAAAGRIYILRNPYHQDAVIKIGRTSRVTEERAREITAATGVPAPFEVMYEEEVHDTALAERLVHERLEKYRITARREFFRIPLKLAVRCVFSVCTALSAVASGASEPRVVLLVQSPLDKALLQRLKKVIESHHGGIGRIFVEIQSPEAACVIELGTRVHFTAAFALDVKRTIGSQNWNWYAGPLGEVFEDIPF